MSIDTERLATDRAYWDSVAPEGATHYDPEDMGAPWMMETTRNWMFYWGSKKEWVEYAQKAMLTRILARLVIRPDAPEEWDGTGFPPVGTVCEGVWLEMPDGGDRDFEGMIIKGYYKKQVWFCTTSGENITHLAENVTFRPARTQAQREREGLIIIATRVLNHDDVLTERHAAEALYDAGMLKLPEGYRIER